jgi:type I restriction enzyme S subunit
VVWNKVKVGELGRIVTGKTPKTAEKDNYDGHIMFVTPSDNMDNKYIYSTGKTITEKGKDSVKGAIIPAGSVCVSCIGSDLGKVVITTEECVTNQQINSIVVDTEKYDTDFIYYAMLILGKKLNFHSKTSTAVPIINKSNFSSYEINCPSLDIQKQIASVLSALDSKIEKNTEINNNLEEQAQTLFRSYFIKFEPYGCTMPLSWKKVTLDDVCQKITDGSHYSPVNVMDAPYPMYSVKDMETYGFNHSSCKHITEEEFAKMKQSDCVPKVDDILVAKDGSYLKEIFICSDEKDEAILSSIAIFRPDKNIIIPEILLYLLKQPSVRKDVGDNYVSGSALPRIVLKDFKKYSFILPPMHEQKKIGAVLRSIRMKINANIEENRTLSKLRDSLLPKLMSGELDVSNLDL